MNQPKRPTYKAPQAGQSLMTPIMTACRSPILQVKFSNLVNPFYYPNSPSVPRYSVTCIVDPEKHKEFLKNIQNIEKNEKVESIIKNETVKENSELFNTGKVLIKFQGKDKIPVFVVEGKGAKPEPMDLEDELARGEDVVVTFDIYRFTKKNTMQVEHGITFKPVSVHYLPKKENT